MKELKIASINCDTGIDKIKKIALNEAPSLSQYDIILFGIMGIPEDIDHRIIDYWKQQLSSAYDHNRLIIVMLHTNYPLSRHSYTTTQGCFWVLPFAPRWKQTTIGTDINHCISNNKPLSDFIKQIQDIFGDNFFYSSIFDDNYGNLSTILRNDNNEPIGFINQDNQKCCLLIPQINFQKLISVNQEALLTNNRIKPDKIVDSMKNRFVDALVNLYKSIHTGNTYEPEPEWLAANEVYKTNEEIKLEDTIRQNKLKIVEIDQNNKQLEQDCLRLGQLRYLLFGHDKPLENSVNYALQILGAEAREYKNPTHNLQIDNLIHYNGITILGEDKGHDGYANNDDINQLIGNHGAYYDIECNETDDVPKAVLFINSERKTELSTRNKSKSCSDKVIKLSKAHKIPIIWTPDLFTITKYVKDSEDFKFAQECFDTIIQSKGGIIDFPDIPNSD